MRLTTTHFDRKTHSERGAHDFMCFAFLLFTFFPCCFCFIHISWLYFWHFAKLSYNNYFGARWKWRAIDKVSYEMWRKKNRIQNEYDDNGTQHLYVCSIPVLWWWWWWWRRSTKGRESFSSINITVHPYTHIFSMQRDDVVFFAVCAASTFPKTCTLYALAIVKICFWVCCCFR